MFASCWAAGQQQVDAEGVFGLNLMEILFVDSVWRRLSDVEESKESAPRRGVSSLPKGIACRSDVRTQQTVEQAVLHDEVR